MNAALPELPPITHNPGDTILARYWFRWTPATVLEVVDRPATNPDGTLAGCQLRGYRLRFLLDGVEDYRCTNEVQDLPQLEPARYPIRQTRALIAAFRHRAGVYPTAGPEAVHPATVRALHRKGFARPLPETKGVWATTRAARDAFLALVPNETAWELVKSEGWRDGDPFAAAGAWVRAISRAQARERADAAMFGVGKVGEFIPHLVTVRRSSQTHRSWSSNGAHERWTTRFTWWVRCHTCDYVSAVDGTGGAAQARRKRDEHRLVVG